MLTAFEAAAAGLAMSAAALAAASEVTASRSKRTLRITDPRESLSMRRLVLGVRIALSAVKML
jgi:hypothetical protein